MKTEKKSKWWNNGVHQTFSEFPPDSTYVRGRLKFNNKGAAIGATIQKGKVWVHNFKEEKMVYKTEIPAGYIQGRLREKLKTDKVRHFNKGTKWWNNGETEVMSVSPPDNNYIQGRLKK